MILRLHNILEMAIAPALALLPKHMDTLPARVMLLSIGLQESRFEYRRQLGNGPARGFWQCEPGTRASHGGVWGVYLHHASMELLRLLCRERDCAFDPMPIWEAIERDDVLAAGVARLLLWTDAWPLPAVNDIEGSWACYLRIWRPGKPHLETWAACHARAFEEVFPQPKPVLTEEDA